MKLIIKYIAFSLLSFFLMSSCTPVKSTYNSFSSIVQSMFNSTQIVENKIKDPFLADTKLAVLWIGHSTVLIQMGDKFILTDPLFTGTHALLSKRLVEPGIEPQDLPDIDITLLSHLHMDHLSFGSLNLIESKIKKFILPENALAYLPKYDFKCREIKWWETIIYDGVKISATPLVHNGWRYGIDQAWMKKSYGGYIISYDDITIFFAGDTAYDEDLFLEIGKQFNDIDLVILPISPIHPREYSKARHTDPKEALQIFYDLNADYMMPIHYDTFAESYDTLGEAESLLRREMLTNNLTEEQIKIFKIGEQKVIIK
ncbi:MAG: MBL fold metallo-hydrolase [Ignavibacteriae bacterium]|nr:MBL fold metallo-hydrolase [Ignavibacteriota bacterium]NOG98794.1 MBL fold metallo-hydrolase [Ignavibacteriota bacterium]